ncbi:MAG: hypothetical protein LIO94_11275 [Clostridiales bacterium]|nr:hypothetical protein [Clostridiales bacterium]
MIIDSNTVFFDGATKDGNNGGQTENGKSGWVPLTGFLNPGQVGPIPIHISLSGGLEKDESLDFTLKQADSKDETGGEEAGTMTVKGPLRPGGTVAWRFIPRGVTKPWMKLEFTASVTTSSGSVFAAIVREDLTGSYQDNTDLLIDKGRPQYQATA